MVNTLHLIVFVSIIWHLQLNAFARISHLARIKSEFPSSDNLVKLEQNLLNIINSMQTSDVSNDDYIHEANVPILRQIIKKMIKKNRYAPQFWYSRQGRQV